jgi:transposase
MSIEIDDVFEYIDWASKSDIDRIIRHAEEHGGSVKNPNEFTNQKDGTYHQSEKRELLSRAFDKYTLEELEHRLGSKWDLI